MPLVQPLGIHAFLEALKTRGVGYLFHLPGTQTLSLLSVMAQHDTVRPIFVRHEQAAAFGAVGYAKLTGRVGVCMSVPGPGATNMLTGVAAALADCVPLVAVTPQIAPELLGRAAVHDADLASIFRAAVKVQVTPQHSDDLGPALAEALDLAMRPPAGPVQLLFPASLLNARVSAAQVPPATPAPNEPPPQQVLDRIVGLLRVAKRPIIYAGDRVAYSRTGGELITLAERLGAPVITDEAARGVIPEDHPLALGTASYRCVDDLLRGSDVCLAVGTGFSEWSTLSWTLPLPRPLIHLNDDPTVFNRSYQADVIAAGHLPTMFAAILGMLADLPPREASGGWGAQSVTRTRTRGRELMLRDLAKDAPAAGAGLHPLDVVATLREELPRDVIVCVDGSTTGMWMSEQAFPILAPGGFIQPEVFKELGSALLMGQGCALGAPERPVVVVQGDGGFLFQVGELSSLVQNKVRLVVVVFDDGYYNADRIYQQHLYGGRSSDCEIVNPDFPQLMASFGLLGRRAATLGELRGALRAALSAETSMLIAVPIDPSPVPNRLRVRIEDWRRRLADDRGRGA